MKSRYLSLGPVEIGGVKEEIVKYEKLPPRADKAGKYSSRDSFLLNDGRYVYRDCDDEDKPHGKPYFYHVIEITDPKLLEYLECLDYFDHQEEKKNRKEGEALSYKHLNYKKREDDGDDDAMDPIEEELYKLFQYADDSRKTKPLPLPSEYSVIKCAIQQMTPADQRVFEMGYDSFLSDMEIKRMYDLEHSAWSNEKKRFQEKLRNLFIALGYDVPKLPTEEELDQEEQKAQEYQEEYEKAIAQMEEEEAIEIEAKEIRRELREQENHNRGRKNRRRN